MLSAQELLSYLLVTIGFASVGYTAGSSIRSPRRSSTRRSTQVHTPRNAETQEADGEQHSDDSSDSDCVDIAAKLDPTEEYKMALVVRTDLGMSLGKIAAQTSHATLACYTSVSAANPSIIKHWERTGQLQETVRCDGEDDLLLLQAQAQSLSLCARTIQDAGRTEIASGSRTVLGIGPGPARLVNRIIGHLVRL